MHFTFSQLWLLTTPIELTTIVIHWNAEWRVKIDSLVSTFVCDAVLFFIETFRNNFQKGQPHCSILIGIQNAEFSSESRIGGVSSTSLFEEESWIPIASYRNILRTSTDKYCFLLYPPSFASISNFSLYFCLLHSAYFVFIFCSFGRFLTQPASMRGPQCLSQYNVCWASQVNFWHRFATIMWHSALVSKIIADEVVL